VTSACSLPDSIPQRLNESAAVSKWTPVCINPWQQGLSARKAGKDYTLMPHDPNKTRLKVMSSLATLAIVMVIAAIAQYTGKDRRNPYEQPKVASTPRDHAEPRAVFGDTRPQPTDPAPTPKPTISEETSRSRIEIGSTPEITDLLNRWRDSVIRGDVNAHTVLYAPKMDHFFRQRNVTRAAVKREKARMMELYPKVSRYEISDVRLESQKNDEAVVSFRKEWDMSGDRPFSGAERQRLKLRRISGDWKIVSEEELKVYWVKRS
jgi:hypothetical protein